MMRNLLFYISFLFASLCFSYQYDLSICTIFRDEAPYLKEWIEFHIMIGVQHFYLCNHLSKDNYREILDPYIKKGIVELTEILGNPQADINSFCFGIQIEFYNECLKTKKDESKWIAFIDSDEFLCLMNGRSLRKFLTQVQWRSGMG